MVTALGSTGHLSWGRAHRFEQRVATPASLDEAHALVMGEEGPILPYGRGRSYGDSCLNDGGLLIDTRRLDRFISLDSETGVLVCEAGVTLADILKLTRQQLDDGGHWFLPVTPGTKFVTVGGAIANDVHGKNHPHFGTFGRHVLWLDLYRSDGARLRCSRTENEETFQATVGGLGLTGFIARAAVQLVRVPSLALEIEDLRMDGVDDYFRLSAESVRDWQYCAAWVDVLAHGRSLGRGIYTRARHAPAGATAASAPSDGSGPGVPIDAPSWLLNRTSLKAFNAAYARKLLGRPAVRRLLPYDRVLYPLDGIRGWNRLYGRRGLYQYQCVVPAAAAAETLPKLLERVAASGEGSFLVVVKEFGPLESPGLLSFPMAGTTFALDFPNRGAKTLALMDRLDEITVAAGGRIYPAKDGRMSAATFRGSYPGLDRFTGFVDPKFSSSFWRRTAAAERGT